MPSESSTIDRRELCGHAFSRTCCLACRAENWSADISEATAESSQHGAAAYSRTVELQNGKLRISEQRRLKAIEESEAQKRDVWAHCSALLQTELVSTMADIKKICDDTEKDSLQAAFEADAAEREEEIWRILQRRLAAVEEEDVRIYHDTEDPAQTERQPFRGLDPTSIPATPDVLITEGLGLQTILKYSKGSTWLPKDAVGPEFGHAVVGVGRALCRFSEELPIAESATDAERNIANQIANICITAPEGDSSTASAAADLHVRTTEAAHRQQGGYWGHPTTSILSTEDQWDLFSRDRYMSEVSLLCRWYVNLVREKEAAEKKLAEEKLAEEKLAEEKLAEEELSEDTSGVSAAEESCKSVTSESKSLTEVTQDGKWPPVEGLDFAGLTNWVSGCKAAHPKLNKDVLQPWKKERMARAETIASALASWKAPVGFIEAAYKNPDPSTYYSGKPLGVVDKELLKLR
ncbi:hypothetical protein LTR35_009473 [Friedmanniomyces endolithicus]|uniref:Uncharacterized protein n=1 Tax=Friedmanniomyces endolithicus TaxID=329885 RepID=A0AAN6FEX7_9PEZI|nr:hypothetical protein LTR35_009473 [Friedmanniomyces endolithicus]KAK0290814.1 hypothetical protein LTS00_008591 [Friedmanniomyces endolithicus]KAK0317051.1 hypothetical protein LTR82_011920 [Friedmanniomyces endolithicus]KAK0997907.1 hypothetical protein LTR54_009705 [Friedmanniomyces endolithicus]